MLKPMHTTAFSFIVSAGMLSLTMCLSACGAADVPDIDDGAGLRDDDNIPGTQVIPTATKETVSEFCAVRLGDGDGGEVLESRCYNSEAALREGEHTLRKKFQAMSGNNITNPNYWYLGEIFEHINLGGRWVIYYYVGAAKCWSVSDLRTWGFNDIMSSIAHRPWYWSADYNDAGCNGAILYRDIKYEGGSTTIAFGKAQNSICPGWQIAPFGDYYNLNDPYWCGYSNCGNSLNDSISSIIFAKLDCPFHLPLHNHSATRPRSQPNPG
jgi:hypothetical protein